MKSSWCIRTLLAMVLGGLVPGPARPDAARDSKIERLQARLELAPYDVQILVDLAEELCLRAEASHGARDYAAAHHHLDKAFGYDPENVKARAFLGLLKCLEARDLSGATAKTQARSGLSDLDRAVARQPEHLGYRVIRASVATRVPRSWGRLDQAKEDLTYVEFQIRRNPGLLKTYDLTRALVYLKLGRLYIARSEAEEAKRFLQAAVRANPGSSSATKAEKLLLRYFP